MLQPGLADGQKRDLTLTKTQEYERAWPVLLASILGSGTGVAVLLAYSLGSLLLPLEHANGWTRAQIGAASLMQSLGILSVGAFVGSLADRYGARKIAIVSQVLLVLALAGLRLVLTDRIWTLYVGYFVIAMLGAGTLPMVWGRCIVRWFAAGRGLALGLSLIGTGICGAIMPTYINWLIEYTDWRGAYSGLAALPLCLGLPAALLLFREPQDARKPSLAPTPQKQTSAEGDYTLREALRTRVYWQITLAFVIVSVATGGVLVHSMPLLAGRGVDRAAAAAMSGLFGISVSTGRLISGYFLDIFGGAKVAFVMFVVPSLACAVLLFAGNNLLLCGVSILLVGIAAGAESDIAAFVVAKFFGTTHFGAIYGLLYTLFTLGSGLGPLAVGAVYDRRGSYDEAIIGGLAIFLLAALMMGSVKAPEARSAGK